MAFLEKTDPFGLAGNDSPLKVVSVTDNATAQVVEAHDSKGAVVAHEVFGETIAPSADYKLKGSGSVALVLGTVTTYNGKKVMLGNVAINTSAGGEPTVSASGEQVEADATTGHTFDAGSAALVTSHHAAILFNAFTLGGTGCHLINANYTASASIGKATADGEIIASDVTDGKIEAQVTVTQTGTAAPTLTPGDGWSITAPLTCSNPDADYPTWTASLTKYLSHS